MGRWLDALKKSENAPTAKPQNPQNPRETGFEGFEGIGSERDEKPRLSPAEVLKVLTVPAQGISENSRHSRPLPSHPPTCGICGANDWLVALTDLRGRRLHVSCWQTEGGTA